MKKLLLLMFLALAATSGFAQDAVYVWVDGSKTCYQLEQTPTVTYRTVQNEVYALIRVSGQVVLTLQLTDKKNVVITYGEYVITTDIENVNSETTTVRKEGKFIKGGKLIIIKGDKHYNIDGTEITNE